MSKKMLMQQQAGCKIAVVGLGCYYPGANSPLQLWENILARRQQFRDMPDVRLPNSEYFDPDPLVPNKTYQNKAAVIDGFRFDWLEKRIPKQTYESTDIVHWLALDTALQAIANSGYSKENLPKEKTGVILGNTLTGEFTRSNQMLLRWPFVRKALRASARRKGLTHIADELEPVMEEHYKSVFAPVTEDTLAGGLANTIAGRICNYLDIHGGGYIVDGACSSSLLAVITAANYLELGQMDMVIAGGVDISLDTFELIGFAKTGALTPDEMRVYDKAGKGFLPGEGCGMTILKRLEDAERDKDQIYAVIDGWGISSDGKGGITAPSAAGQSRALIRAHEKAGLQAEKLDFIEGHGTGTTVGDKVELEGISIALNNKGAIPPRNCGVTSFKSIVGHTKAAAGIGALIKTVMAVNRRILPPTAGMKDPNPIFDDKATALYPITHGQVRDSASTIYAGVSAMGFGGINSHVLMESGSSPNPSIQPSLAEKKLLVSCQSHELFLFSASSREELTGALRKLSDDALGMSYGEMADLACLTNGKISFDKPLRAAIVASSPTDLTRKLNLLESKINNWNDDRQISEENSSVSAGIRSANPRIGALFPGQGSQKLNMARKLTERHDWLMDIAEKAAEIFASEGAPHVIASINKSTNRAIDRNQLLAWQHELKQTNIAQPAITLASLIWYEYLTRLGISVTCVTGHSLGELMAFYAAGLINAETLLRFAAFRGKSMAESGSGTMASLQCTRQQAEKYVAASSGYVTVANVNAPGQTVISGETESVKLVIRLAEKDQVGAIELPVSAAFHSKLVAEVGKAISTCKLLKNKNPKKTDIRLISTTSGEEVENDVDLNNYFSNQAVSPVDFISAVHTMEKYCDVFIEIGPGKILSGLVNNISDKIVSFPAEMNPEDDFSINALLGNVFVLGCDLKTEYLYHDRLIRDFVPAREKSFLINPLERPFPDHLLDQSEPLKFQPGLIDGFNRSDTGFKNYLKARRNFINEVINTDYKYFTDQHSGSDTVEETDHTKVQVQVPRSNPVHDEPVTDARTVLFARIESMTGFSRESFKDEMRLLDDFNLDSIKSGALLSAVSKSLNITGKINNTELANASLGEIIGKMEIIIRSQPGEVKAGEGIARDRTENDVPKIVFDMLSSKTGFPVEALKPEYRLLDDLNLDSIKAGAFISELSKRFNISGKLSTAGMANAAIENIIKKVTALIPAENAKPSTESPKNPVQAKAYSVTLVEEPIRAGNQQISEFWKNKSLAIAYTGSFEKQVEDLIRCMKTRIDKVISVESNNLHLLTSLENTCILVFMPHEAVDSAYLEKIVELLAAVARKYEDAAMLGFIQFNDGRFLREINYQESADANYSAVSFAASLHHERPDIKIRVIEADRRISDEVTAGIILSEFASELSFDAAGYDFELTRRTMKYGPANVMISRKTEAHFNNQDVVVATGGAKGITAACALAFAGRYLCKTALIGSSPLNDEIENTLQQYRQKNLTVLYYPCDISDMASVKQTTEKIQHDLGEITVVIHGAGRNIPRRASQVLSASALSEIGPKISGAINLCEALKDKHLRYFVALTSIIGITGMPGNSWYAFSNENLDLYLRATGKKRQFKVRTIAYSIWDEIGMGARMGSNQVLAGMGIGSIPPAQGVEHFLQWIEHDTRDQQVAVSAEMGTLDTWNVLRPRLPEAKRYISDIRFFEPGKELIARVKLSRTTDLYLDDHNYNGSLLFPTVFGLEAMAQAAFLLSGIDGQVSITFENISLIKPIVVPDTGDTEIEIKAVVIDEQIPSAGYPGIFVGISTEHSGFSTFHFSSEITFMKQSIPESREIELSTPLMICPETDLYTWLLFQGPKFQNIKKVYRLNSGRTEFLSCNPAEDPAVSCFAADVRTPFLLGSPLLRDVLLQSVQLFLTKKRYLPVGIKRWEISAFGQQGDNGYVTSELRSLDEERGICDVGFIVNGQITERIEGYSVKALESTSDYADPDQIADLQLLYEDIIAGEFEKYMSLAGQRIEYRIYKNDEEFNKLDAPSRHAIEDKVFETMIPALCENEQVTGVKIVRAPNGKPSISSSDKEISISHSRSLLFITAGPGKQGCDIEYIEHRKQNEWDDMLDNKYGQVLEQLKIIDNDYDLSATRIWCVREALIKSLGMIPLIIGIEKVHKNGVIFRIRTGEQSDIMVLTFSAKILPNTSVVISTLISMNETGRSSSESHAESGTYNAGFDKSIGAFTHDFLTTFKDCKGFFGKSHYTNYPDWMGSLRELVLAPIADELLNDLGSGNFGMVTNSSEVQIFNQADTLNHLTGKLWITGMSDLENSFIDLHFEFTKNVPGSNIQLRLAKCNLSTTWVKIESRGVVKKSPIPDYFREFLNKYLVQQHPDNPLAHVDGYPELEGLGNVIYEGKQAVRPQTMLMEKEFATGISNGNTVGNLYYSNYYNWQSAILEQYLYQLVPEIMLSSGQSGEFLTLRSNVNHLQEAMPFEAIVVSMYIDKVFENGLKFYFEYFSKTGSGNRKLAYGSNTVIWCRRQDEKHVPVVRALPEKILNPIMGLIVV